MWMDDALMGVPFSFLHVLGTQGGELKLIFFFLPSPQMGLFWGIFFPSPPMPTYPLTYLPTFKLPIYAPWHGLFPPPLAYPPTHLPASIFMH